MLLFSLFINKNKHVNFTCLFLNLESDGCNYLFLNENLFIYKPMELGSTRQTYKGTYMHVC